MNIKMSNTEVLSLKQNKIVQEDNGAILVMAGPGSGKTMVLTRRIARLLSQGKKRVLALTFSNKAADEIRSRINQELDEEIQSQLFVGTIHGFCLDVVMNRGNLIGLPNGLTIFESEEDRIDILKEILNDSPEIKRGLMQHDLNRNTTLESCIQRISSYKKEFISPESLVETNEDENFIAIYAEYNQRLIAQRALDFDDILFYAYRIFDERPQVAKMYTRLYKYILVDEAQDLNKAQYRVLKAMCKDFENIMLVGDPNQSIYGFNGSTYKFMTEDFVRDFSPKQYTLIENYRSSQKIIEAARVIKGTYDEKSEEYPIEGEIKAFSFSNEYEEAKWILKKIQELKEVGNKWTGTQVEYEKIAIIARNRYVFGEIKKILLDNNIPINTTNESTTVQSESTLMKIFELGIRVLINPHDTFHYNQILKNIDDKNIDSDLINNDEKLILLGEKCNDKYPIQAFKILKENEEDFTRALESIKDLSQKCEMDERYLIEKDIQMWKEHWKKYCANSKRGMRSLADFRNMVSLGITKEYKQNGISLLTVHRSKGLEFDVVFLPGLSEGTFPDYRAKDEKSMIEEDNNMYVALTRAKRSCYISYSKIKKMPWGENKLQQPSRYFNKIKTDIVES